MRARNLKPGFFRNPYLARCSFQARVIYAGLPGIADCMGRLKNDHAQIEMELIPRDTVNMADILGELEDQGLIRSYGGDSPEEKQPFIWIPDFLEDQKPCPDEKKRGSKIPRHPDDPFLELHAAKQSIAKLSEVRPDGVPKESADSPEALQERSVSTSEVLTNNSLSDSESLPKQLPRIPNTESRCTDMPNTENRTPKPDGSARVGSVRFGSADLPNPVSESGKAFRKQLWQRLKRLVLSPRDPPDDGRDPPWYEDWWRDSSKAMADTEGGLLAMEEFIKYAEDCADSVIRGAKDLGEIDAPARWMAAQFRNHLKKFGLKLPAPPKAPQRVKAG